MSVCHKWLRKDFWDPHCVDPESLRSLDYKSPRPILGDATSARLTDTIGYDFGN